MKSITWAIAYEDHAENIDDRIHTSSRTHILMVLHPYLVRIIKLFFHLISLAPRGYFPQLAFPYLSIHFLLSYSVYPLIFEYPHSVESLNRLRGYQNRSPGHPRSRQDHPLHGHNHLNGQYKVLDPYHCLLYHLIPFMSVIPLRLHFHFGL